MFWPHEKWTKRQKIKDVGGGGGWGGEGRRRLQANPGILKTLLASERDA